MALRLCESEPGFEREQNPRPQARVTVPDRVVGIDPGLNVTGYAVVEPSPRGPLRGRGRSDPPVQLAARRWASGWRISTRASWRCSTRSLPARSRSSGSTATSSYPAHGDPDGTRPRSDRAGGRHSGASPSSATPRPGSRRP